MRHFLRPAVIAAACAVTFLLPAAAFGRMVFMTSYKIHDNDAIILGMLGYQQDEASVLYFREMASVTKTETDGRTTYEPIGCDPYYIMSGGKKTDLGYNCRSFACVGYMSGTKQCKDTDGNAYGGVVEIGRRLSLTNVQDSERLFSDVPVGERTAAMDARITELADVLCKPFYLMSFEVAVGEGYRCEEIGRYPNYSAVNRCVDDWRGKEGLVCETNQRENELVLRRQFLGLPPRSSSSSSPSSSSSSSSSSSVISVSSASSSVAPRAYFPDVQEGKYGYTAIVTLGGYAIVSGYEDGTFRPGQTVNRAEFSKMLLGGLFSKEVNEDSNCFEDVQAQWFARYVCAARRMGWVRGYGDGLFRPERTITKAEALKIVIEASGIATDTGGPIPFGIAEDQWYAPYVRAAVQGGLILEPAFYPEQQATRADAAVWIYRAAKRWNMI